MGALWQTVSERGRQGKEGQTREGGADKGERGRQGREGQTKQYGLVPTSLGRTGVHCLHM